jgi:hypothetical protein
MDNSASSSTEITVTVVDVLCKVGNQNIIYIGELVNYYLNKSAELDAILLRYPMRRKLDDDNAENPYYSIPSDYLYIPYKDVANLNINYFNLDQP